MQKQKSRNNSLLEGAILPSLMKFALPILFSLMLQALYGAVDLWTVSTYATRADISAVATGSQTMMIAGGLVTGLALGMTVLLGRSLGQNDGIRCANIVGSSIWLFTGIGLFLTTILLTCAPLLAEMLNSPAAAFEKTVHYLRICGLGTTFIVGFNILNSMYCATGDSRTPLIFVGTACVINIIGDLLLIAHFHLGAVGAAIATAVAQSVSVALSLSMIKRKMPFRLRFKYFLRPVPRLIGDIVKLGSPIALQNVCNELSFVIIIGLVNAQGIIASSGVGIAEKLVMFILLIPVAYMSSISAFVAQNMGAGQPQRAHRALITGICTAVLIGGTIAYTCFFHGCALAKIFTTDMQIRAAAAEFLKATAIECFVLSVTFCFTGFFNGLGRTAFVMTQGLCATLLVRIPYAFYASSRPDPTLFNIGFSAALAAIFMFCACISYYIYLKHSKKIA